MVLLDATQTTGLRKFIKIAYDMSIS